VLAISQGRSTSDHKASAHWPWPRKTTQQDILDTRKPQPRRCSPRQGTDMPALPLATGSRCQQGTSHRSSVLPRARRNRRCKAWAGRCRRRRSSLADMVLVPTLRRGRSSRRCRQWPCSQRLDKSTQGGTSSGPPSWTGRKSQPSKASWMQPLPDSSILQDRRQAAQPRRHKTTQRGRGSVQSSWRDSSSLQDTV
jgi:hypothetical protein